MDINLDNSLNVDNCLHAADFFCGAVGSRAECGQSYVNVIQVPRSFSVGKYSILLLLHTAQIIYLISYLSY